MAADPERQREGMDFGSIPEEMSSRLRIVSFSSGEPSFAKVGNAQWTIQEIRDEADRQDRMFRMEQALHGKGVYLPLCEFDQNDAVSLADQQVGFGD